MTNTGWVYHELYMWHDTGRATAMSSDRKWLQAWEHYENPETKRRFRNLVEVAGLFDDLVALKPRAATVVLSHEGGYAPTYVPFCGLAVMEELSGVKTPVNDPLAARAASAGGQDLQPHQDEIIRRAERLALTSPSA